MDLRKALFIGTGHYRLASVQIRCIDIASQLGCDYLLRVKRAKDVPKKYTAFICVKADFSQEEIYLLSKRGVVIWDIIDYIPPKENVSIYLVSNKTAQELFAAYGRIELIHHHHCNLSGAANPAGMRRPSWIGTQEWFPLIQGFKYDYHDVAGKTREEVVEALRETGIGLNLRIPRESYRPPGLQHIQPTRSPVFSMRICEASKRLFDFHLAVNSGIKLINCIGFGIPSISSDEPAYREIGERCTIFSELDKCAYWVKKLQKDRALYNRLRRNCLRKSPQFNIANIAGKYFNLITSL